MSKTKGKLIAYIDGLPVERLSPQERRAKFDREIGPDIPKLPPETLERLKKFYLLEDDQSEK